MLIFGAQHNLFAGALLALSDNPAHLALARDAKVPRDAGHSRSVQTVIAMSRKVLLVCQSVC